MISNDTIKDVSKILSIQDAEKLQEKMSFISENISPYEYIEKVKETIDDSEFNCMNGDCGALAITLDMIYSEEDDSSFAILFTSRGEQDEEEQESLDNDLDEQESYLWRLSRFGEMKHILWKDGEGQYYDVLGKYGSIASSMETSEEFYNDYGMPSLDLDSYDFKTKNIDRHTIYTNIVKGTRITYDSPVDIIDAVYDDLKLDLESKSISRPKMR